MTCTTDDACDMLNYFCSADALTAIGDPEGPFGSRARDNIKNPSASPGRESRSVRPNVTSVSTNAGQRSGGMKACSVSASVARPQLLLHFDPERFAPRVELIHAMWVRIRNTLLPGPDSMAAGRAIASILRRTHGRSSFTIAS